MKGAFFVQILNSKIMLDVDYVCYQLLNHSNQTRRQEHRIIGTYLLYDTIIELRLCEP